MVLEVDCERENLYSSYMRMFHYFHFHLFSLQLTSNWNFLCCYFEV